MRARWAAALVCCAAVSAQDVWFVHAAAAPWPVFEAPIPEFAPGSLIIAAQLPWQMTTPVVIAASDGVRRPLSRDALTRANTQAALRWRIPDTTPPGPAKLLVENYAVQDVVIVPRRFELFRDSRLDRPVSPGQRVVLTGTGLGLAGGTPAVTVIAGANTVRATVSADPEAAGVDRVEFVLPASVKPGCRVPLQVDVDGVRSMEQRTLAVAAAGEPCPEAQGIDPGDLAALETCRCVPAVTLITGSSVRQAGDLYARTSATTAFERPLTLPEADSAAPSNACVVVAPVIPRAVSSLGRVASLGRTTAVDARNQPLPDEASKPAAWDLVPEPPPSGEWRVRLPFGEWALPVTQLRWLNRVEAGSLALDRDYSVIWDSSVVRAGDRVSLTLSAPGTTILCAAEASRGALTLPAWMLREVSPRLGGTTATVSLELTRPTEIRRLTSGPYRYLVIENRSSETRDVVLP